MLRQFILFILLLTFISACSQNGKEVSNTVNQKKDSVKVSQEKTKGPLIKFETEYKIIGNVLQGSELSYKFEFTNTGDEPLIISNVRTSCHCTVASYTKTPILPGKSDIVKLDLDTEMLGQFTKDIVVYSNALNGYAEEIDQARALLKIRWVVVEEIGENTKKPE